MNKYKEVFFVIAVYEDGNEDILIEECSYAKAVQELQKSNYDAEYFYVRKAYRK